MRRSAIIWELAAAGRPSRRRRRAATQVPCLCTLYSEHSVQSQLTLRSRVSPPLLLGGGQLCAESGPDPKEEGQLCIDCTEFRSALSVYSEHLSLSSEIFAESVLAAGSHTADLHES
eukprot:COSAG01_NODE_3363_length_6195_cov_4.239665_7_plen_117_part_00